MATEDYKELASRVLRNYGRFLKDQNGSLSIILNKLQTEPLHKLLYPIDMRLEPFEAIHFLDIIESDNRILKKIIATFSFLCNEMASLQYEAKNFYCYIALYDEKYRQSNMSGEEFISENVEYFCKMYSFIKRCHEIVINYAKQICGLASGGFIDLKSLKIGYIMSKLGDMLYVLVALDHLINCSMIRNHWTLYRRAVKLLHKDARKYNETSENLTAMEIVLNNIQERVISDRIYEYCVDSLINLNVKQIPKNGSFIFEEMTNYLKKTILDLERSTIDFYESTSSVEWIKINALYVFISLVFGNADKKVLKTLLDVNCKAHSVPLFGTVIWYPEQFLSRHISHLISSNRKLLQNIAKSRQMYINNKKQTLSKDVYNAQLQVAKWSVNMNETFSSQETQLSFVQMNHRTELLHQGVKYASQIKFLVQCLISIHMSQSIPITKNTLTLICKLIEILKCVEEVFQNNYHSIYSSANIIIQHITHQLSSKLLTSKKALMNDKNYSKQMDELTALVVVERALKGPPTLQRRIVINITLSFVSGNVFNDQSYTPLLESVESVMDIKPKMEMLCNCMFLYWNKFIISHYFHKIANGKQDLKRLPLFLKAINDSFLALQKCDVPAGENSLVSTFANEVHELLDKIIIEPASVDIETNLRLLTHTHLNVGVVDPFTSPVEDVSAVLALPALKLHRDVVSVVHGIEHYLSYTFYNLTTVVLHDWKTYGEMRQLANTKFQLKTVQDNLPTQTLEQGLDILEIMRNIHTFVSKYLYNLNNQIFIEHTSNSKTLNTINIFHIANSIRTHGTGIMNTTVNFTYQFLRKKFHNFSQFMYDEQIKSRLIKDMKHFRESSMDSEQAYTYKRADKFNKGIRNLGLDQEGRSYLDLFRILITEIGNAMGYVRMVRSGGLHCCSSASAFLPSLDDGWSFDELLQHNTFSQTALTSIKNLEDTINCLISNFSNGTEYFKLFVDVFAPVFRNPDNVHLKAFYIIVPPLTLNFVENILLCKDKLNKKNTTGAAFTDDGFAMGLAYILKLLDQEQRFDSLHWFESVTKHIAHERKNVEEQLSRGSTQVHQALALTQKKLNILEQEFQLLYFSFSSARIFFQL